MGEGTRKGRRGVRVSGRYERVGGRELGTHLPSKYQGLTREKSQPCASSGNLFRRSMMNCWSKRARRQGRWNG